jgi:hypothetical protein
MGLPAEQDNEPPDFGTPEWWKKGEAEIIEIKPKGGKAYVQVSKRITYLQRLERSGSISTAMLSGAEKFGFHFQRGGLERFSTINLFRVMGGIGEAAQENALFHRKEVRKAVGVLGGGLAASLVWDVCGLENPISHWTAAKKSSGLRISDDHAKGMLIGALEILARHYGY